MLTRAIADSAQSGVALGNETADEGPRLIGLRQGLRELGWVEGTTITYERRFAEGLFDRLPELARELAQSDVAAIATASTPPALAAKAATSTIPIVIMDPGDPVAAGLVRSLSRPGGNVTGISSISPELAAKRLEILKDIAPAVSRAGMLYNAAVPPAEVALKEMLEASALLGVVLRPVPIRATGMPAGDAAPVTIAGGRAFPPHDLRLGVVRAGAGDRHARVF